jgi:hypothetical protein
MAFPVPPEITSQIFSFIPPGVILEREPDPTGAPLLFMQVCRDSLAGSCALDASPLEPHVRDFGHADTSFRAHTPGSLQAAEPMAFALWPTSTTNLLLDPWPRDVTRGYLEYPDAIRPSSRDPRSSARQLGAGKASPQSHDFTPDSAQTLRRSPRQSLFIDDASAFSFSEGPGSAYPPG